MGHDGTDAGSAFEMDGFVAWCWVDIDGQGHWVPAIATSPNWTIDLVLAELN